MNRDVILKRDATPRPRPPEGFLVVRGQFPVVTWMSAPDESFALSGSATLTDEKKFGGWEVWEFGGWEVVGLCYSLASAIV